MQGIHNGEARLEFEALSTLLDTQRCHDLISGYIWVYILVAGRRRPRESEPLELSQVLARGPWCYDRCNELLVSTHDINPFETDTGKGSVMPDYGEFHSPYSWPFPYPTLLLSYSYAKNHPFDQDKQSLVHNYPYGHVKLVVGACCRDLE